MTAGWDLNVLIVPSPICNIEGLWYGFLGASLGASLRHRYKEGFRSLGSRAQGV